MNPRMHPGSLAVGQEYLAFISYRHADNTEEDQQWATWLHQQLEVYDVPDDLIGTTNLRGQTIPDRIYPVFRDEVSLPADAVLSTAITQALDQSRFLIVLCSPRAVQSRFVNEEILHFKRTGKQDHIMAALILGEPNASIDPGKSQDPEHAYTLECFPPALQYELTAEGQLDKTKPTEPIAANFRLPDGGKGITNPNVYKQQLLKKGRNKADAERLAHLYEEQINTARLKIIAGILGVPLERLTQRDKIHQLNKARAESRRFRKIAASLAVLTLVTLIAGGIAFAQWRNAKSQQLRAENLLSQIKVNLKFMNFELRGVLDKYVPQHERIKIMQQIDAVVEVLQQQGNSESVESQRQIAAALMQKADQALTNDKLNPADALPLYQQAHNALIKLCQRDPGNTEFQRDLSNSHDKIGNLQQRLGHTDVALNAYQDSLAIRQTISQHDPGNTDFQHDLSASQNNIGDLQLRRGNTDAALKAHQDSLAIRQTISQRDPNNTHLQRDLSVSHERIGDLQLRLGNTDAALKAYRDSLAIRQTLTQRDAGNTEFQRDLSVSHSKIGDLQLRQGNTGAALKAYQDSLAIAQTLSQHDPSNTVFQRDLSVFHNKIGDLQLRLGNTNAALKSYQDDLAIVQTLTQHDPGNTQLQRDLSVSHNKIGDLQLRLGNTDAALKSYQNGLAIAQNLTQHDPGNTQLKRDLSVYHDRIGDLQLRLGNTDAALKFYQDGLAIRQNLSQRDPGNTQLQRDMSASYYNLFLDYEAKKEFALARKHLENALTQLKAMQSNGSLAKDDEKNIKEMEVELLKLPKPIKQ